MRKILITGGAGNVGSSLANKLVEDEKNFVVIVDNLTTGSISKLPDNNKTNWKFIKADVNQYNEIAPIMTNHQFDFVFHYAAVVGVKRTLENPIAVLEDVDGMRNVLNLSKNLGVKRVFFSSSSEVYGEPLEFPQRELTTPLNARLPYAIVKSINEAYLRSYYKEHGLNYTIFRFFNTYGPRQSEDFVIVKFLKAALANNDITLYGDGLQTRTFCFADDNVEATINCLNQSLAINQVVNIGNDNEMTVLDLAKKIIQITNSTSKIIHLAPLEEGDMTRRCPDISNMKKILNRQLTSLEEGLLITMKSLI